MFKGRTHRLFVVGTAGVAVLAVVLAGIALAQKATSPLVRYGPYYATQTFVAPDGTSLERAIISGPPTPPPGYELQRTAVALPVPNPEAGTNSLTVPTYQWTFGCSATSGAMILGYWDRNGYSSMYTGPTNGGVAPLDGTSWPDWNDGHANYHQQCPFAASKTGWDGRVTKGSFDDYWVSYLGGAADPYIAGNWYPHAWGDAIGDYMYTSQSKADTTDGTNDDGSTQFWNYTSSGSQLTCSALDGMGYPYYIDGTVGRRNFYQAKGYTVSTCYNQNTDNKASGGFSFAQYMAEIDAGRPVMLNLVGHTIVGVGYNTTGNTVYIHDTWDNSTHSMTWGGSYSGMDLYSVSIVNVAPLSGARFYALTPCRLVDTRHDGGAFTDGETRTYNFNTSVPYTGTGACSTIPTGAALSLSVNFQVTSHMAYLTAYPDDASLPTTSTVVAYANGLFAGNTAIVPTGADNGIKVYAQYAGHVVIDINGYFK
jgi:YD repeat-containing protein